MTTEPKPAAKAVDMDAARAAGSGIPDVFDAVAAAMAQVERDYAASGKRLASVDSLVGLLNVAVTHILVTAAMAHQTNPSNFPFNEERLRLVAQDATDAFRQIMEGRVKLELENKNILNELILRTTEVGGRA